MADPPEAWIEAKDDETLDERLAEEVPDISPEGGGPEVASGDDLDRLDTQRHGTEQGQIDGTPEDGGSFFTVVE